MLHNSSDKMDLYVDGVLCLFAEAELISCLSEYFVVYSRARLRLLQQCGWLMEVIQGY
jgi:hypothetical protein